MASIVNWVCSVIFLGHTSRLTRVNALKHRGRTRGNQIGILVHAKYPSRRPTSELKFWNTSITKNLSFRFTIIYLSNRLSKSIKCYFRFYSILKIRNGRQTLWATFLLENRDALPRITISLRIYYFFGTLKHECFIWFLASQPCLPSEKDLFRRKSSSVKRSGLF